MNVGNCLLIHFNRTMTCFMKSFIKSSFFYVCMKELANHPMVEFTVSYLLLVDLFISLYVCLFVYAFGLF